MLPLFDMMTAAQNGDAVRMMARQFGLSEAQAERAIEALMPAFSTGLKRNASNPQDLAGLFAALSGGRHAAYFDDVSRAFSPTGLEEGNGILGHMFGSKEVSRAVAAQAAQATGIGEAILKQMLPVLASVIMGGLFKQSTGQLGWPPQAGHAAGGGSGMPGGMGGAFGGNILGQIMEQMAQYANPGAATAPQGTARGGGGLGGADNPFGRMFEEMLGGGAGRAQERATPAPEARDPLADNPLGQIFRDMLGGATGGRAPAPRAEREPEPEPEADAGDTMPSGRPRNPYDDLFGKMFESGREVQAGYQKNVESIFDQYLKGLEKHRGS